MTHASIAPYSTPAGDPASVVWTQAHSSAAQQEGWDIFGTANSEHGPWRLERLDDASDTPGAIQLGSDREAWTIVMNGVGEHHLAARRYLEVHSPQEWHSMALQGLGAAVGTKTVRISLAGFRHFVHSEVIEVPADITAEEVTQLVNLRYSEVDMSEYLDDPGYWERGNCVGQEAMPGLAPTMKAVRTPQGLCATDLMTEAAAGPATKAGA